MTTKIPPRVANTLLNALKGGVVPRTGLGYITVGRKEEIDALLHDVDTISVGGASFRFIVGKFGAGKSFLLQTIRNYAMERGFVVIDADLSPERRFVGSKGEGLATYRELMKNLSTHASPDGGALGLLLSKWISALKTDVMAENTISADDDSLNRLVEIKIHKTIDELETAVHGFDFAKVISLYWKATVNEDDETKSKTLKWLRGEYSTKTEAKHELGVGVIINDSNWYDYVKLMSLFVIKAGYKGTLMIVDELVNLYKIPHTITRQYNFEKILTMYNDIMQGKAHYLGVIMGGTPESIADTRRGIFSYEALKSRLESSRFSDGVTRDLLSPIITLKPLVPEEMYFLIQKLEHIHGQVYKYEPQLSSEDLQFFIKKEYSRVGSGTLITPREMIRDFIEILNIMLQNPNKTVKNILQSDSFAYAASTENNEEIQDNFKGFEL
ncbi:MAG: ATP-binding protein [Defluviitaleaceae bacterium]|nr:ATP-binding protein [Defluviitaleaceae bacterium]